MKISDTSWHYRFIYFFASPFKKDNLEYGNTDSCEYFKLFLGACIKLFGLLIIVGAALLFGVMVVLSALVFLGITFEGISPSLDAAVKTIVVALVLASGFGLAAIIIFLTERHIKNRHKKAWKSKSDKLSFYQLVKVQFEKICIPLEIERRK